MTRAPASTARPSRSPVTTYALLSFDYLDHFVTDRTEDGRQLKLLVVIDEFTRECLAIEPARLFKGRDVIGLLQYHLFAVRGAPDDNGPDEFVAREVQRWLSWASVRTLSIQKASPWENDYMKSFNGKLRG